MTALIPWLVLLCALLPAAARDVEYRGLTLSLASNVTAEVMKEPETLALYWKTMGPDVSPLFLLRMEAATNVQKQIATKIETHVLAQTLTLKMIPTFRSLAFATNEVTLGGRKVTEILVTARYRDRDFGTMRRGLWFFAAAGGIWHAALEAGGSKEAAEVRAILAGIKPDP